VPKSEGNAGNFTNNLLVRADRMNSFSGVLLSIVQFDFS